MQKQLEEPIYMNTKTNNETTDKTLFLEKFDKKTYMKKYREDPANKEGGN